MADYALTEKVTGRPKLPCHRNYRVSLMGCGPIHGDLVRRNSEELGTPPRLAQMQPRRLACVPAPTASCSGLPARARGAHSWPHGRTLQRAPVGRDDPARGTARPETRSAPL